MSGTACATERSELSVVSRSFSNYVATGDWRTAAQELVGGAMDLTESRMGFYGVVLPGKGLRLLAWKGEGWDAVASQLFYQDAVRRTREPDTAELPPGRNLFTAAVESGQTVITGDPLKRAGARGMPPGHPRIDAFLGVPVRGEGSVQGLLGLANRPGGYDGEAQRSAEIVGALSGVLCQAYLNQRKQRHLEDQLRHAQRMEAVGRLAGGVAHDFNNLLQVINGYTDLMLELVQRDATLCDLAERIRRAGGRAATLTRQLLAFSRKQVLDPRVVDLAEVVTESQKMFMRLIGEDVEVKSVTAPGLWKVHADPGQVEQVLMNLVVNARDAMPDGGRIVIELANATRDGDDGSDEMPEGRYVRLSVTDTGHGIPSAVLPHIFEPFYTTKPLDRGTGLGLSTVHGIVAQSGGYVRVYSEVGSGTTFHVYLPSHDRPAPQPVPAVGATLPGGHETVLVVDDEGDVRNVCERMLARAGYTVLLAQNPPAALEVLLNHDRPIHLLITDVVMPGGSGPALVAQMRAARPDTAVIYMSGYTEHASLRSGFIEPGAHFLNKPFERSQLLTTARHALSTGPGGARKSARELMPRALVVDDALMNRELMKGLLHNLGWTAEEAADGEAALAKLATERFDMVLLDVLMPRLDGYETARRWRARAHAGDTRTPREVPIIGVTAMRDAGEVQRCLAAGMTDYIAKPLQLEDLDRVIKRWRGLGASAEPVSAGAVAGRLTELERELGRIATQRLARMFLADLCDKRRILRLAAEARDSQALVAAAHAVRGSSANLGGTDVSDLCGQLEERARSQDMEDMGDLLRRFESAADRLQDEVGTITGT